MTEVFNELSVIGVELNNEDRVVHLLASLPECYSTLVTALEANAEVPIMETVIERLLHEERKLQERSFSGSILSHQRTLDSVKRIMRYLKGTIHLGLFYSKGDPTCVGYSDADWGGDSDDHKSTSGFLFQFGGTVVTWHSQKQSCVALSTAEAEYMALASTAQDAVWLKQLIEEVTQSSVNPLTLFEDNQSAISIAKNPRFHNRTKHIGIKYHYIREQITNQTVELIYCPTEDMLADVLTKGLTQVKFERFREMFGLRFASLPSSENEC